MCDQASLTLQAYMACMREGKGRSNFGGTTPGDSFDYEVCFKRQKNSITDGII